jgi:hypothetical protein
MARVRVVNRPHSDKRVRDLRSHGALAFRRIAFEHLSAFSDPVDTTGFAEALDQFFEFVKHTSRFFAAHSSGSCPVRRRMSTGLFQTYDANPPGSRHCRSKASLSKK